MSYATPHVAHPSSELRWAVWQRHWSNLGVSLELFCLAFHLRKRCTTNCCTHVQIRPGLSELRPELRRSLDLRLPATNLMPHFVQKRVPGSQDWPKQPCMRRSRPLLPQDAMRVGSSPTMARRSMLRVVRPCCLEQGATGAGSAFLNGKDEAAVLVSEFRFAIEVSGVAPHPRRLRLGCVAGLGGLPPMASAYIVGNPSRLVSALGCSVVGLRPRRQNFGFAGCK